MFTLYKRSSVQIVFSFFIFFAFIAVSNAGVIQRTEAVTFSDLNSLIPLQLTCPDGTTLESPFARALSQRVVVHSSEVRDTNTGRRATIRLRRVSNQNDLLRIIDDLPLSTITVDVEIGSVCTEGVNVLAYGSTGDGVSDDTRAIQRAIDAAPAGSTVYFPRGNYRITDELIVNKRLTIKGDGFSSQIFQATQDSNLFSINLVRAVRIADLFLGSAATFEQASLIKLDRAHYSRIERVAMGGGVYGIHELGSIGVVYEDLKTVQGIAAPGYFALSELSGNKAWYFSQPQTEGTFISSNANLLINPILRAGERGISIQDSAAQGNHMIVGGIIEANSAEGLYIKGNGQPITVLGTHFEANGTDILVDAGNNVGFNGILSTVKVEVTGNSTDINFNNSMLNRVDVAQTAVRTSFINTITDLDANPGPHLVNNADDTLFLYTGTARSRLSKGRSTLGIGTASPPNKLATPFAAINVEGKIYASEGFEPDCPGSCPVDPEPPTAPEGSYYLETQDVYADSGQVFISVTLNPATNMYEMKYEDARDFMDSGDLEVGRTDSFGSNCCDTSLEATIISVNDSEMVVQFDRRPFNPPASNFTLTIPRAVGSHIFECSNIPMCPDF